MATNEYHRVPDTETTDPEVASASTIPFAHTNASVLSHGLHRKLSARQVQMIAIGGAIGTG